MKKTTTAILGLALSFAAQAQTAEGLLNSSHLEPQSTDSATTIIMYQSCQAARKGINAGDFADAVHTHYKAYNWSKANFDSLIDAGYGYAKDRAGSDCAQLIFDVIDGMAKK